MANNKKTTLILAKFRKKMENIRDIQSTNESINQCVYFRLKTYRTETVGDRLIGIADNLS